MPEALPGHASYISLSHSQLPVSYTHLVGAFLAVANGVRIFIQYHNPGLAVVIACSLMGTVIMAKLVGCTLPLLAKKVNLDPAIMASPLITTLVDTFSILIYFNIATVLFRL